MVAVYHVAVAAEVVHGSVLFSIDVCSHHTHLSTNIILTVHNDRAGLINMHIRIRIAYFLIGATYIAVIISILAGCHPIQKNWQINPNPGNYCQPAVSHIDVYVTVVLNVATDVYLISIPTPVSSPSLYPVLPMTNSSSQD